MDAKPASRSQGLRDRTFAFSCAVVIFGRGFFAWREPERTLTSQLVRAAVSVGSNAEEAAGAQTRPDFLTKISIALKEARESHFLLRVIRFSGLDESDELAGLIQEANELVSILTASVKTTKRRILEIRNEK
jgi:four helix bundle protein